MGVFRNIGTAAQNTLDHLFTEPPTGEYLQAGRRILLDGIGRGAKAEEPVLEQGLLAADTIGRTGLAAYETATAFAEFLKEVAMLTPYIPETTVRLTRVAIADLYDHITNPN